MLAEIQRYLTLRAPPWSRRLGLVYECVAITSRRRRAGLAWEPHLQASRAAIIAAADRCPTHRRVLIIGAGDCVDVPVTDLASRFDEVVLTDVVLGPELRSHVRRGGRRVRAEIWDATGALAALARDGRKMGAVQIEALLEGADPGAPPGGEPDLVVSANCISQLGVVPLNRFRVTDDKSVATCCAAASARNHLRWLAARPGVRVLIGDRARLDVDAAGCELRRQDVPGMDALRPPDRTWRWMLAPIPELSRRFHRIHEVGAWIDA